MRWLVYIVLGLIVFLLGCITGANYRDYKECQSVVRVDTVRHGDTVVVRDTVMIRIPVAVRDTVVRWDTAWMETVRESKETVTERDTVVVRDSVEVIVPITQRVYADTVYTAWVSGYRPSLDSIEVYPTERRITEYVEVTKTVETVRWKNKRWGVGVTAGYGYTGRGFAPFVGVGLSYSIVSF